MMNRIELLMSVVAGLSGGLAGVLWSGLASASRLESAARDGGLPLQAETLGRLAAGALLRAGAGAALGFLYWLGWGLIAVLRAPWPANGLLFGLLCWAGAALPVLAGLGLRIRLPGRVLAVQAVDWLVTCLAVGLACAYAWHRLT